MSRGPGRIERALAELFRKSGRDGLDRSYTVADLCAEVFGTPKPTRSQRVSVLRAAHALLRRARAKYELKWKLWHEAQDAAYAKYGEPSERSLFSEKNREHRRLIDDFIKSHPAYLRFQDIPKTETELSDWRATEMADRTVVFHHQDHPVRVWAVDIAPGGIKWVDAEVVAVTKARVSVVYQGVRAPLDRVNLLSPNGTWWRGVRFVSERSGRRASWFEKWRHEWFRHRADFVKDAMSLDDARRIIGLRIQDYSREDVIAAFRKAAKRCHPDLGGTAEKFRELVVARDRLLAAIGTSAPAPKEPTFAPAGARIVYRRVGRGSTSSAVAGSGGWQLDKCCHLSLHRKVTVRRRMPPYFSSSCSANIRSSPIPISPPQGAFMYLITSSLVSSAVTVFSASRALDSSVVEIVLALFGAKPIVYDNAPRLPAYWR